MYTNISEFDCTWDLGNLMEKTINDDNTNNATHSLAVALNLDAVCGDCCALFNSFIQYIFTEC